MKPDCCTEEETEKDRQKLVARKVMWDRVHKILVREKLNIAAGINGWATKDIMELIDE